MEAGRPEITCLCLEIGPCLKLRNWPILLYKILLDFQYKLLFMGNANGSAKLLFVLLPQSIVLSWFFDSLKNRKKEILFVYRKWNEILSNFLTHFFFSVRGNTFARFVLAVKLQTNAYCCNILFCDRKFLDEAEVHQQTCFVTQNIV